MLLERVKKMLFKPKGLVGLDIGSSSIKAAVVKASKKGYVLKDFELIETPFDSIESGEILSPGDLSDVIRDLFAKAKLKLKDVAVNIWGSAVIVKKITIPQMELRLVAEQVRWEAEQYIPFDINEICLEHHVLEGDMGRETMDVILVAAKRDFVGNYSAMISAAGLNCKVLDVSNFALANCFEANYGRLNEVIALLNFGSKSTSFIVIDRGDLVFSRDIPIGGVTISTDIHKELGVTLVEADSLRLSAISGQEVPEEVQRVIQASMESISDEIQNSFDFFFATATDSAVSRFFYTGGSAQVPGLIEQIKQTTGLAAEELNPFLRVGYEKNFSDDYIRQIKPFAAVAIGLAMRAEDAL